MKAQRCGETSPMTCFSGTCSLSNPDVMGLTQDDGRPGIKRQYSTYPLRREACHGEKKLLTECYKVSGMEVWGRKTLCQREGRRVKVTEGKVEDSLKYIQTKDSR